MIIVLGSFTVESHRREEAVKLSVEHVNRSRQEPGCMSHEVSMDAEKPNRLVFVEKWQDMDALQVHFAVPESIRFMERVREIAQGSEELNVFKASVLT